MSDDNSRGVGATMMGEMIARATASCVRTQAELAATPSRSLRVLIRRQGQLRIMQDTLARLVAEQQPTNAIQVASRQTAQLKPAT